MFGSAPVSHIDKQHWKVSSETLNAIQSFYDAASEKYDFEKITLES
jgi:hypothetical protein